MKVAVVQMVSSTQVMDNVRTAQHWVAQASADGAQLVVLPEYFGALGVRDTDKLDWAEAPGSGPVQQALAACARSHGVWLVAGTLPIRTAMPGKVYNRCVLYGPDGQQAASYDKVHLFRFSSPQEQYDESRVIAAGQAVVVAPMTDRAGHVWQLGLSVCYDLRFPELYRQQAAQGAHILLAPSAFTHTTGQAHWEVLLRARAIENQCWMLAAAQGGVHDNGRTTWGHSMVVDPWGQVLAQRSQAGAGVVYAELDWAFLQQVRTRLPALEHRCL